MTTVPFSELVLLTPKKTFIKTRTWLRLKKRVGRKGPKEFQLIHPSIGLGISQVLDLIISHHIKKVITVFIHWLS
jgi:hypothetical protein